jgi:LacI family transcriptional regulator
MEALDFVPNKIAQMLTTNRSHTLELIAVNLYGGRFADSIKNMAQTAKDAGFDHVFTMIDASELAGTLENAAARMIDGIVLHAPSLCISDEDLLELCNGLPLVRRDYVPDSSLAWVGFNQVYATRLVVEHLIELGHRQIAAIPPSLDFLNGQWRYTTWKETLEKHGLELGPMCPSAYTFHGGYEAMQKILASGRPFTAVMMGSDTMAFGAMRALREHHIRIPEDVSILSFDNSELAQFTEPPLTTVAFDFRQQDTIAVKYLVELLNDPDMQLHQRLLLSKLIIRESTRKIEGP